MANEIPNINYELNVANTVPAPVDVTLSVPGEAADAAAVGAALAQKVNTADLRTAITVNGQPQDSDGDIDVAAGDILMGGTREDTVAEAVARVEAVAADAVPASDIADNLTTDDATKALSAAQGVAIAAALAQKLAIADVVDDLETADATKALSANQGVALATMGQQLLELVQQRVSYDDLANNLTTDREGLALDARQGAALKALIDALTEVVAAKLTAADIVDALTSSATNKALSAKQGALIKSLIDDLTVVVGDKLSAADLVDDLDATTTGKALDARQGRAIRLLLEAKLSAADLVDDLETTTTGKALDARQGNMLATTKLDKADVVDDLQTSASTQALSAKQGKALNDRLAVRETELDNAVMHFDDLVTSPDATSAGKPLDASVAATMSTQIGQKLDKASVVNDLTVTAAGSALDARAGKVINDKIDNLIDMSVFGNYASVDDAVADIWDSMSNGSFHIGRVTVEGVATFIFQAFRNSANYASALLFSYGGDLRQYNKVNGTISGYRFTHQ